MCFTSITIDNQLRQGLINWIELKSNIFVYSHDDYSALLLCYILVREIGGPNDDLIYYIYDLDTNQKVTKEQLAAEIVKDKKSKDILVKITSKAGKKIGLTEQRLVEIIPTNDYYLTISPKTIANKIFNEGLTPVFVKSWLMQAAFSTFDLHRDVLSDQLWVLNNNHINVYAKIVKDKQVVFQSMHDIVGHIAGITKSGCNFAAVLANLIHAKIEEHFGVEGQGNIPSHIIPFVLGLLLDDLTQPIYYFSNNHAIGIKQLLTAMDELHIDPKQLLILKDFPQYFDQIILTIRDTLNFSLEKLNIAIENFINDFRNLIDVYTFSPNT